jgi:hypothetical protein
MDIPLIRLAETINQLETVDAWTVIATIMNNYWKILSVSYILTPMVVFSLLFLLLNSKGKVTQGELWAKSMFILFLSMIIGTIMFLMLSITNVPLLN